MENVGISVIGNPYNKRKIGLLILQKEREGEEREEREEKEEREGGKRKKG